MTATVADINRRLHYVEDVVIPELRQQIADALALANQVADQYLTLDVRVSDLSSVLGGLADQYAALAARVSELEDPTVPPPPPPPPTYTMQIGVERGVQGMSLDQAFADLQQRVGVPIPLHHTYDSSGNIPTAFSATPAAPDVARGVRSMLGIHYDPAAAVRGDLTTRAQSLAASAPDKTIIILWHEWDAHGQDPVVIAQSQNLLHDVIKAVKPTIEVWACTTGWFFDPGNKSGLRDRYAAALDPKRIDGVSIDAYQRYLFPPAKNPDGTPHTGWDPAPTPQMATALTWCKALGVRLGIAETCCASDATHPVADKIKWWSDLVAWGDANGLGHITYFDTQLNQDVGPGSMIEDQPEFMARWAADVTAHA